MKQKVLIVEDNISLSQRQKDWLEQAGYDVMTAMHEPAARALIRKHRFDFILSDVRLPEGDGISLLEWLTKEKKDIPFIVTTEYGSIPDAVRAIKLGAKDYLPFMNASFSPSPRAVMATIGIVCEFPMLDLRSNARISKPLVSGICMSLSSKS